jgi:hypothetical protein
MSLDGLYHLPLTQPLCRPRLQVPDGNGGHRSESYTVCHDDEYVFFNVRELRPGRWRHVPPTVEQCCVDGG